MKEYKKFMPFLALFAVAIIAVMVIRSVKNAKRNNVTFFKMLWYEFRFLFSLTDVGSIEAEKPYVE